MLWCCPSRGGGDGGGASRDGRVGGVCLGAAPSCCGGGVGKVRSEVEIGYVPSSTISRLYHKMVLLMHSPRQVFPSAVGMFISLSS
jgi:hypothetical protein